MNAFILDKETIHNPVDGHGQAEAGEDGWIKEDVSIGAISCLSCPLYCHPGPGRPSA